MKRQPLEETHVCEACERPFDIGDKYMPINDGFGLCEACAPSVADIMDTNFVGFTGEDDETMNGPERREFYLDCIKDGMKPGDTLARHTFGSDDE